MLAVDPPLERITTGFNRETEVFVDLRCTRCAREYREICNIECVDVSRFPVLLTSV